MVGEPENPDRPKVSTAEEDTYRRLDAITRQLSKANGDGDDDAKASHLTAFIVQIMVMGHLHYRKIRESYLDGAFNKERMEEYINTRTSENSLHWYHTSQAQLRACVQNRYPELMREIKIEKRRSFLAGFGISVAAGVVVYLLIEHILPYLFRA